MPQILFHDFPAQSICDAPITAAQASVQLRSTGAFKNPGTGQQYSVLIQDTGNPTYAANPLAAPFEYQPVQAGGNSFGTNTLTFGSGTRAAYANTTPRSYYPGATISAVILAEDLQAAFMLKLADTSAVTFPVSSVTFSSIPQTYRHLLLACRVQTSNGGATDAGYQFNGDASNNYAYLQVFNNGAGPQGGASAVTSSALATQIPAGTSSGWLSFIGDYTTTSLTNRPVISTGTGSGIVIMRGSYWNQGAAVASITVVCSDMIAGSYISLYGIP